MSKQYWVVETHSEKMIELVSRAEENLDQYVVASKNASNEQRLLIVPDGVVAGNCKIQNDAGVLSLVDGSADKSGLIWDLMRDQRNRRLSSCDWTQLADSPLSSEDKASWATYRQSLRDLPQNTEDPDSVTWPEQP